MKTNRSNKLFDQTRIATLGLQDLLAFGQLQPDGTYKVRNVTNSNFLNAIVISEQITYAEILALATASELVAGKNYTITNAVSGTLSLYIFAVSTSKLAEYGYDTTTGQVYSYDLATDTATNADNTGYINFTPQTAPAYQRGRVWYDSTTETLSVYDDISGTSVQLGQEEILRARNSTGSTILNGAVVYVSGAQGQNPRVSLALANAESTSRVIGVATHNIDNNTIGKITTFGIVGDLNTSAYNEGDVLYLSASVAGGLTTTRPSAPNQAVMVGTVIHAAVNDGKILVHTDNYGVGFGTANQVRGMNAAGTAEEYKTIQGTASEVEVLHTANTVTIGLPNAVTISGAMTAGSFVKSGGGSAQFLKADGTVDANAYFYTNAQVTGQALTGLSVSGSAVVSTDSILSGIGKLQNQINAVLGSVNFQGVWNASTNTPTLTSSVGTKGYYYIVTVAGSTNLNGITDWKLGDWAIYDGSAWQKVDNTDAVVSVNGYTGIVTLAKADIGLGNVENTALSTWAGSTNITTLGTIGTGVWQGTAIADAYISSATTWNAKIGGSGTPGKLAKFTSSGAVGDSIVSEASNVLGVGLTPSTFNSGSFGTNTTVVEISQLGSFIGAGSGALILGNNFYSNATDYLYARTGFGATSYQMNTSLASHIWYNAPIGTAGGIITFTETMKLTSTELITFGATDTGEAHIFGGSARVNGAATIQTSAGYNAYFQTSGTSVRLNYLNDAFSANVSAAYRALNYDWQDGAGSIIFSLASSGAATFSGQVNTNALAGFHVKSGSDTLVSLGYSGGVLLNRLSGTTFYITENGSPQLTIASGGAATFSSSVTAQRYLTNYSYFGGGNNYNIKLNNDLSSDSGFIYQLGGSTLIASNSYYNSAGLYTATATSASSIELAGGATVFYNNSGLTNGGTFSQTERMRITSAGNVGIGTTSPNTILHVAKSETLNAFTDYLQLSDNTNGLRLSNYFDVSGIRWDLRRGTTTMMSFSPSNNVLIGTTTDDGVNKLQVNGSVNSTLGIFAGRFNANSPSIFHTNNTASTPAITAFKNTEDGSANVLLIQSFVGGAGIVDVASIKASGAATFLSSVQATTLKLTSVPTSSAGLSAGDIWNNGGVVNIV